MPSRYFRGRRASARPRGGDPIATALAHYGAALREAATGGQAYLHLVDLTANRPARRLAPHDWCADRIPGDGGLLARCSGPTLDVGCGPGRLAAALTTAGVAALGVDVSAEAVRQARRRGARAQCTSVFAPIENEGEWQHVLLADGNIGIGGDPERLLRRCRELLTADGDILVEVDPPGSGSWRGHVALRRRGRISSPFRWAAVATDDLEPLARNTALSVVERWTHARRWFARLSRPQEHARCPGR